MSRSARADDPALIDRLWVGYHPLALLPWALLLAVLSLLVWTGHWYLDDVTRLADALGDRLRFALAWAGWPVLAAVFLYRTVTFTYRLTDRCLLVDFGPLHRPVAPIPLRDVTTVVVGGGMSRWLGVGWVEVRTAGRVVRLTGVRRPGLFAMELRGAVAEARNP